MMELVSLCPEQSQPVPSAPGSSPCSPPQTSHRQNPGFFLLYSPTSHPSIWPRPLPHLTLSSDGTEGSLGFHLGTETIVLECTHGCFSKQINQFSIRATSTHTSKPIPNVLLRPIGTWGP